MTIERNCKQWNYSRIPLVKLELLSNATTIDSALNYIRDKQQEQHKRLVLDSTSNDNNSNDGQLTKAGRQTLF